MPTPLLNPHNHFPQKLQHRRHLLKSFKAREDAKRSASEKFADWMTNFFGTIPFLVLNGVGFTTWVIANLGWIPGFPTFDPFPFVLLTTIVSLEAIFLAIIVLVSQNRAARVADLREEVDLQVNVIAESEITKLIYLLSILLKKQGIDLSQDPDLQQMLEPLSPEKIEQMLEKEIT